MKEIIPTKLDIFNIGQKLTFDVNTPQFIKEASENCEHGIYAICWNIFRQRLCEVAERASELNDPILNVLMIRLNLYEIENKDRYKIIKQMKEIYESHNVRR